jgi:hypothetical protein
MKVTVQRILSFIVVAFIFCMADPVAVNAEDSTFSNKSSTTDGAGTDKEIAEDQDGHSFLVGTLLYIPNRVLDILDIIRLRVRVGPGIAVGVRATKVAQAYLGTYASVYAGLPGPRLRSFPKSPIGLESNNGVSLSVVDATVGGGIGPDYSPTEFGAGLHLGIIGFDFGIDPLEIVDFATGILTIDVREDDL